MWYAGAAVDRALSHPHPRRVEAYEDLTDASNASSERHVAHGEAAMRAGRAPIDE